MALAWRQRRLQRRIAEQRRRPSPCPRAWQGRRAPQRPGQRVSAARRARDGAKSAPVRQSTSLSFGEEHAARCKRSEAARHRLIVRCKSSRQHSKDEIVEIYAFILELRLTRAVDAVTVLSVELDRREEMNLDPTEYSP